MPEEAEAISKALKKGCRTEISCTVHGSPDTVDTFKCLKNLKDLEIQRPIF